MGTLTCTGGALSLVRRSVSIVGLAFVPLITNAQSGTAHRVPANSSVPALMLSDIHFEPFWDPDKAVKLAAAPVNEWKTILAAPDSPGRADKFAAIEQQCRAKGEDTNYSLFASSLQAIKANAAAAKFVTVSGDLMAHKFDCKFKAVFPQGGADDYRVFAEKTIEFVVHSLRENLPGTPVYAALGNNDSGCKDYGLDPDSAFLSELAKTMTADVPSIQREQAQKDFAAGGNYAVTLPSPIARTRLLVLEDLFMSREYKTCGGDEDPKPAAPQIAWLRQQLDAARKNGEKVWVMAHIPPGVDAYSTATKGANICAGKKPTMFLSSEDLPQALAGYSDVVRLVIFGHTHMDEMRLLAPEQGSANAKAIPVKLVSSISPVDGNNPSITFARIDAATGTLKDYRVIAASASDGAGIKWSEEYDFAKAYQQPDFSALSLKTLFGRFDADPTGQSSASQSYIHNYEVGRPGREIGAFWPLYVCMLKNNDAKGFAGCACNMLGK